MSGPEATPDTLTLRAVAVEASELGVARAMERLGLDDADAVADVRELRQLLAAWRDAKRSAWRAVAGWVAQVVGTLVLAALAVRLGFEEWLR